MAHSSSLTAGQNQIIRKAGKLWLTSGFLSSYGIRAWAISRQEGAEVWALWMKLAGNGWREEGVREGLSQNLHHPSGGQSCKLYDAVYPHLQFFLGLGHQIECTKSSFNNAHEIILKFLPNKARACMHPHCTLTKVYLMSGFAWVFVPIVLQDVRVATHAAMVEDKPALVPGVS